MPGNGRRCASPGLYRLRAHPQLVGQCLLEQAGLAVVLGQRAEVGAALGGALGRANGWRKGTGGA